MKDIICRLLLFNVVFYAAPLNAQDLKADNMLLFQRKSGGWPKHFNNKALDYNRQFTEAEKAVIKIEFEKDDATIDNSATTKEIRYLAKAGKQYGNDKYLGAVENGLRYLLQAQYKNGGWPQYFPDKTGYRTQVTYNDNAMVNVLTVLQDVAMQRNDLDRPSPVFRETAALAVTRGVECILKTQIRVNGKLTGWCQQYDHISLRPAKARAYELPSISGAETVGIIGFLMTQPNPSKEIKEAVIAGVEWLKQVQIAGYALVDVPTPGTPKGTDKQLVPDETSTLWARYYEINTNRPFFCDRDGVVVYDLKDIGYERRNGYAWYGTWAANLLQKKYPEWAKHNL